MKSKHPSGYYQSHREQSLAGRQLSRLFFLRKFNNWVKLVLILKYAPKAKATQDVALKKATLSVLDLCCGKGADLYKWNHVGATHYVGVDIAINRLREARDQIYNPKKLHFGGYLKEADLGVAKIKRDFPSQIKELSFNIVSCQFSAHYLFQSQEKLRTFLENVSAQLKVGGFFIGTTPDSDVLVSKLRHFYSKSEGNLQFGNEFYSIRFKREKFPKSKPFGIEYGFYLEESVGQKIPGKANSFEYVPEYLVIMSEFERVAKDYGLVVVERKNFHQVYKERTEEYEENKEVFESYEGKTWRSVVQALEKAEFKDQQWDIAYLYTTFVFMKTEEFKLAEQEENPFQVVEQEEEAENEIDPVEMQRQGRRELILLDDLFE